MRRIPRNLLIALLSVLLVFAVSCQSKADVEIATPVIPEVVPEVIEEIEPSVSEPEQKPAAAEAVPEVPVSVTYSYRGYELKLEAYDGYAMVYYPATATEDDVEGFLKLEAEKYQVEDAVYRFVSDGILRIDYPEGISAEDRKTLADTLASDLIQYVTPAPVVEPDTASVSRYSYGGYELVAVMAAGRTSIEYPAFISSGDVEAFFAFENAKNDYASIGVVYSIEKPGSAVLTYPETYSKEIVSKELDALVNDLISYITEVPEAVVVPEIEFIEIDKVYSYGGYTLSAVIIPGSVTISYPQTATAEDVETFIAAENEKYDLGSMGVRYTLPESGVAVFTYPETIDAETVAAELDTLVSDLIEYVTPAPAVVEVVMPETEPVVKDYSYGGYALSATILPGVVTVTYPSAATEADVEAFIAAENEKYDLGSMGVRYTLPESGVAVFTYPETIDTETVAAELDTLVSDLISYISL